MPNMVGLLWQGDPINLLILIRAIKETELNSRGIFGEEGEVDSRSIPGGTERIRLSRPDVHSEEIKGQKSKSKRQKEEEDYRA
jgi:hypothetical protein